MNRAIVRLLATDLRNHLLAALPPKLVVLNGGIHMPGKNYPGKDNIKPETKPAPHPALGETATHQPSHAGSATGKDQTTATPAGPNG